MDVAAAWPPSTPSLSHCKNSERQPSVYRPTNEVMLTGAMLEQSFGDLALHAPRNHAFNQRAA